MDSIVKAELRARIQLQRLLSGQEELTVEYPPSPTYELTSEERVKIDKRRRNNRISATKCRQKKRQLENRLMKKYNQLCIENSALEKESKNLLIQVKALRHTLNTHVCYLQAIRRDALGTGRHLQPIRRDVIGSGGHLQPITRDVLGAGRHGVERNVETQDKLLNNQHIRDADILENQNNCCSSRQPLCEKHQPDMKWHHFSSSHRDLRQELDHEQDQRDEEDEQLERQDLEQGQNLELLKCSTASPDSVSMDHSYVSITVDDILNDISSFDFCQVFCCELDGSTGNE
ncbi:uncharacterized protein LOC121379086 [Gigantopelta aegis]|uniref:uncharacterized protein LOC121379086 n=1 Tax=Gigantopelta aegis TaxID=1735272 RepID=UPI001B889C5E|nr:uncharacterized protein LOC121379086 [Gigantopelta aegis]